MRKKNNEKIDKMRNQKCINLNTTVVLFIITLVDVKKFPLCQILPSSGVVSSAAAGCGNSA